MPDKSKIQNKTQEKPKRKVKWKVLIYSLIELAFFALTFLVSYYFAAGVVLFMILGQRELFKKK